MSFREMETKVRGRWPKKVPLLNEEQELARNQFMMAWHRHLPKKYSLIEKFNHLSVASLGIPIGARTLEIGAGLGAHSHYEDLSRQDYFVMDYREDFCRELEKIFLQERVLRGDIQERLPFEESSFDRIVAIHVLEHLVKLPHAIDEILRLLRGDGIFDVVLPCEGGIAYSLARRLSAQRFFEKKFGMSYIPIIKNEHVSSIDEILELLRLYFEPINVIRFPFNFLPSYDLNLVVAMRLKKKKP